MKHIVLYSGGANSAWVAYLVNQKHHDNTILLHTPTYSEHPDADRFRKQLADKLGLLITVQADGRNIWKLIEDERCLPSERIAFCSRILKTEQAMKFYKSLNDEFIVYYGYDGKEWRRAQRSMARMQSLGIKTAFPLIDAGYESIQVKNFVKEGLRICLPEPYLYLKHNNCIPCFKGGKPHFYQVWKYYPDYFAKAEQYEKMAPGGHTVFKDITLSELREQWQMQIPMFGEEEDLRPCMCAL